MLKIEQLYEDIIAREGLVMQAYDGKGAFLVLDWQTSPLVVREIDGANEDTELLLTELDGTETSFADYDAALSACLSREGDLLAAA